MKPHDIKLVHVVACTDNQVIGRQGAMPWHLSADLKFFKATTMGHVMVMGRKTFDAIGRPLPGRKTVVVSRNSTWKPPEGVERVDSLEAALELCRQLAPQWGHEVCIVGGGEIYRQTLPLTARVHLTRIHTIINDGDTFYPELDPREFQEVAHVEGQEGDLRYSFLTYDRVHT